MTLDESAVFVLAAGETSLKKFISSRDLILANLEFGSDPFGATTLYIALLAVPSFNFLERGLSKAQVGITGLPLFE